jgi:hypothetical protein
LIFELDDLSISREIVAACESSARGNPQPIATSRNVGGTDGSIHTEGGTGVEVAGNSVDVAVEISVGVTDGVIVAGAGVGGGAGVPHRDGWHALRRIRDRPASDDNR